MLARFFLILSVLFVVTACESTDDAAVGSDPSVIGGAGIDGAGGYGAGAAVPGTQQDLAVNVGDRVLFGYDSYALSNEARETLLAQSKWLQTYSNLSITIEGHCDERGTREYNLALGERRGNAVKDYLISLGVSASRVNVISYGKERPATPGTGDEAFAQNRRGVTVVQ